LSDEHFSVDGTLVEAWASQKSFRKKDDKAGPSDPDAGNPTVDFHGEKRSNDTHESKADPDARLARKSGGHEAKLAYSGNAMIENRNGLVIGTELFLANGTAERDAAMMMAENIPGGGRVTVAGDRTALLVANRLPVTTDWLDDLSIERYRLMLRLLAEEDQRFLRKQPGFTPRMAARFRTQRCQFVRGYIRSIKVDFGRICATLKVVMVQSQQDRPDLASALVRSQITFQVRAGCSAVPPLPVPLGLGPR
jgi:hypothetical protein